MSTSVLRRYAPPTCTLEIVATGSALSRWTDRQVMKNVRFSLYFDDPRVPSERQVMLQGDRTQLEALCEVVGNYVQQLLDPDAMTLSPALQQLLPPVMRSPETHPEEQLGKANAPPDNKAGHTLATVVPFATPDPTANQSTQMHQGIALRPLGLLSHELSLGTLTEGESGPVVRLSATQLFDLANALDSYAEDAIALPGLGRSGGRISRGQWLRFVAGIVLAVGASAALARFVTEIGQPAPTQVAVSEQQLESAPPAAFPGPAGVPTVPPEDLSVPPPPPAGALPNPASLPPATLLPGVPSAATGSQAPVTVTVPSVPNPGQLPRSPVLVPVPPTASALPPVATIRVPQPTQPQVRTAPAPPLPRPETVQIPELSRLPVETDAGVGTADVPALATASTPFPEGDGGAAALSAPWEAIALQGNLSNIPQLQEAQTYFEERWQPQPNVEQTLEYRLEIAPDGTIARILPLGQVAGELVDRTGIPLMGERFVSPLEGGQRALMRIVLSPDGRVQTFLEQLSPGS